MTRSFAALAILAVVLPGWADEPKFDADAIAKQIAPFVDSRTLAIMRVDAQRLNGKAVVDLVAQFIGWDDAEKTEMVQLVEQTIKPELRKAGIGPIYVALSPANLQHPASFIIPSTNPAGADTKKLHELFQKLSPNPGSNFQFAAHGNVFLAGAKSTVQSLKSMQPEARPELVKALAAAGDAEIHLVIMPSSDHRRVIEELLPELPKEAGGGSSKLVTRGALWIAVGVEIAPKLRLRLTVQAENNEAAMALHARIPQFLALAGQAIEAGPGDPFQGKLLPEVSGNQLRLEVTDIDVATGIARLAERARVAASIQRRTANLRDIAIAFHNYHDTYGRMPARAGYGLTKVEPPAKPTDDKPDWTSKPKNDSKPLLSWRVFILPYIEQQPLFLQFKLDEPWDSEHNKKLIAQMPPSFRSGNRKLDAAGKTRILGPVGKNMVFEPDGPGLSLPKDFPDGTSNTILIFEAAEESAVIWTKPDDLPINEKDPFMCVFNPGAEFVLTAFADASVRQLSKKVKPEMLLRMFIRNDGQVIEFPE